MKLYVLAKRRFERTFLIVLTRRLEYVAKFREELVVGLLEFQLVQPIPGLGRQLDRREIPDSLGYSPGHIELGVHIVLWIVNAPSIASPFRFGLPLHNGTPACGPLQTAKCARNPGGVAHSR